VAASSPLARKLINRPRASVTAIPFGNPRFRLVYRYTPNEVAAVAVEAVAVGRRADLDAYRRAIANLDRPVP
jgi:hypothetical protein